MTPTYRHAHTLYFILIFSHSSECRKKTIMLQNIFLHLVSISFIFKAFLFFLFHRVWGLWLWNKKWTIFGSSGQALAPDLFQVQDMWQTSECRIYQQVSWTNELSSALWYFSALVLPNTFFLACCDSGFTVQIRRGNISTVKMWDPSMSHPPSGPSLPQLCMPGTLLSCMCLSVLQSGALTLKRGAVLSSAGRGWSARGGSGQYQTPMGLPLLWCVTWCGPHQPQHPHQQYC